MAYVRCAARRCTSRHCRHHLHDRPGAAAAGGRQAPGRAAAGRHPLGHLRLRRTHHARTARAQCLRRARPECAYRRPDSRRPDSRRHDSADGDFDQRRRRAHRAAGVTPRCTGAWRHALADARRRRSARSTLRHCRQRHPRHGPRTRGNHGRHHDDRQLTAHPRLNFRCSDDTHFKHRA